MRVELWMIIGLLTVQQVCETKSDEENQSESDAPENEETTEDAETETDTAPLEGLMSEKLLSPGDMKIMFVPKDMENLFFQGASERMNQYTKLLGTSLKQFQENVADGLRLTRHIRSIDNYTRSFSEDTLETVHSLVKRQVRNYVVRCCRAWSCSYSSRQNQRRTGYGEGYGFGNGYGYGYNGYGGYSPWNGFQSDSNVNQGSYGFNSKAVAMVLPQGVSISCPSCAPGWQQQLNFGHGVGYIPITCPGCPKNWRQLLNMGPQVNDYEYEEEETTTTSTTTTTTSTTTTTESTTVEETTTSEETTTVAAEETTTAAAGGGLGGGLGGLLGAFGRR